MEKRMIAIEWANRECKENVQSLLKTFTSLDRCEAVLFASKEMQALEDGAFAGLNFKTIAFSDGIDSMSKRKNFIVDYAKSNMPNSFLHIIEDVVALDKDPSTYISKVESTMDALDYSIYFSTVTDPCNYIFKKFNPRLTIDIDDEEIKSRLSLPDKVSFTSHSNLCWTIYDLAKLGNDVQRYEEKFTVAMYIIIEYLARRRALRKDGQLYYMNQYLSISDEVGVFHAMSIDQEQINPETMKEEDAIFKEMKVNYAPDNNIDIILDTFYQKIKEKMMLC